MQNEFTEWMNIINEFCIEREWNQFHNPKDLAIGISTEANELLDLFRFKTEEQMRAMIESDEKREEIGEELADILFFLLRFYHLYGFDMEEGFKKKMEKNAKKYPAEKVRGKNLKYREYEHSGLKDTQTGKK